MEDSLTEEQQEIVESAAVSRLALPPSRALYLHGNEPHAFFSCVAGNVIWIDSRTVCFYACCSAVTVCTFLILFRSNRYIVTNRGMHAMYEKYRTAAFGRCPHVFCQGQPVLPVGLSDLPRNYTVNVFCPRCHGLFFPKSTRQANIDGAYFGTTFPHLYLMTHPVRNPQRVLFLWLVVLFARCLIVIFFTPGYGPGETHADIPSESLRIQSSHIKLILPEQRRNSVTTANR